MLIEWFEFIRQPSTKIARKMGYVYSTIALDRRYRRQKTNWQPHINNCHALWRELIKQHAPLKLAIIGSGPLIETPIDWLRDQVDEIHIVDIVHPYRVRRRWGPDQKVFLHEFDVTGISDALATQTQKPDELNFLPPPNIFKDFDLIVSANILSQLSLEPLAYLKKRWAITEDSGVAEKIILKLGEDHLQYLRSSDGAVYLYTDIERIYRSPNKEILETHPSRIPEKESMGKKIKSWIWDLCPLGEVSKEFSISMSVEAYRLK